MSDRIECNILLIGKTGTGKSTLANHLFDSEIFTTGTGKPVTGWKENFQMFSFDISAIQINVYDSVGLEPNNYSRWMRELKTFLTEKQSSPDMTASEIMHVLLYVVNGASTRFEAREVSSIQKIQGGFMLPAVIIITNCDIAEEPKIVAIEHIAEKHDFKALRTCSVSKKTRSGVGGERFGKEAVLSEILSASYEKVGKELVVAASERMMKWLGYAKKKAVGRIKESDLSVININNFDFDAVFNETTALMFPDGLVSFNDLIPPKYRNYHAFLTGFNLEYRGKEVFEESFAFHGEIVEDLINNGIASVREWVKNNYDWERSNFFGKVGISFDVLTFSRLIKPRIKDRIEKLFDNSIEKIQAHMSSMNVDDLKNDFWAGQGFILDSPGDKAIVYYNGDAFTAMQALFLHNSGVPNENDKKYQKQVKVFYDNLSAGLVMTLNKGAKAVWVDPNAES